VYKWLVYAVGGALAHKVVVHGAVPSAQGFPAARIQYLQPTHCFDTMLSWHLLARCHTPPHTYSCIHFVATDVHRAVRPCIILHVDLEFSFFFQRVTRAVSCAPPPPRIRSLTRRSRR
jgi:hypothetical protein